ncbi:MAG: hypothetical protein PSV35_08075 [bacterium]|nr:hypothetical protein [bacterium]
MALTIEVKSLKSVRPLWMLMNSLVRLFKHEASLDPLCSKIRQAPLLK